MPYLRLWTNKKYPFQFVAIEVAEDARTCLLLVEEGTCYFHKMDVDCTFQDSDVALEGGLRNQVVEGRRVPVVAMIVRAPSLQAAHTTVDLLAEVVCSFSCTSRHFLLPSHHCVRDREDAKEGVHCDSDSTLADPEDLLQVAYADEAEEVYLLGTCDPEPLDCRPNDHHIVHHTEASLPCNLVAFQEEVGDEAGVLHQEGNDTLEEDVHCSQADPLLHEVVDSHFRHLPALIFWHFFRQVRETLLLPLRQSIKEKNQAKKKSNCAAKFRN